STVPRKCEPTCERSSISHMRCSSTARSNGAWRRQFGITASSASAYMIAPCTFFEPGYSPRSSCSTFMPAFAIRYAAVLPEGPAPTTIASNFSAIVCSWLLPSGRHAPADPLAQRLGERRQDLQRVADHRVGREIHDRRLRVAVDRDDHIGAFDADAVLDRARDAGRDVQLRPDRLAGLPDLPVGAHPAGLRHRTRAAVLAAEQLGQLAHEPEVL